ncbi:CinA family protein [Henriciella sp. AS95]|uniref:CinA family protein n=1 Tax=Henriciella sp. AS95 TaxID=3135782 RepID=UPI003179AA8D
MQTLLPIAEEIGTILKARRETVGVWESSSGGLISAALLAQAGASAYFRGGGVIYAPAAFRGLMGLSKEDLGEMRSSSEPHARFAAGKIRERLRADWGLCETGAAGPDGNGYGDAAGHTCVALVGEGVEVSRTLETGLSDRGQNMRLFAEEALYLLREAIS